MKLVMRRRQTTASRRRFLGSLHLMGPIIDRDFDNDNDAPVTAEPLDWHLNRRQPAIHLT